MTSVLEDPNILARLQPKEFYKRWMEQYFPTRPDQRQLDVFRPIMLQVGTVSTAESSATVKLGDTLVIGAIKLEVAEPSTSTSSEGFLVTNVTLCSGCSPAVRTGPPTDRAQLLTHKMSSLVKKCNFLNKDALVIIPEKLVWVVHLDLFVLNDAGNLFDALWLALLAVLKSLNLPKVTMDEDTGMIYWDLKNSTVLQLIRIPLPLSFAYLSDHNVLVADPTDKEESILGPGSVEILIDPTTKKVCHCESIQAPQNVLQGIFNSEAIQNHLVLLMSIL